MSLVVAAIAVAVAVGVAAERRLGLRAVALGQAVLRAMFFVLVPFVAFFTLARLELTAEVGAGIAIAYVTLAVVGLLAWVLGTRVLHLPRPSVGALIVVVVLVNTGYLGVPLVAAVLGSDDIGPAIAFDQLVSGPMFYVTGLAIGAAFGTTAGETARERFSTFLVRNPPLLAAIAGLLAPASLSPDVLLDAAHVVVYALLPAGFFVLGINLAAEAEEGFLRLPLTPPIATALLLRCAVAPALYLGLSAIIVDVPDAYLVQAAMPSGINSLVVAHVYGLDLRLTSSALAWTTGTVVLVATVAALL